VTMRSLWIYLGCGVGGDIYKGRVKFVMQAAQRPGHTNSKINGKTQHINTGSLFYLNIAGSRV
jgi:hypothetical protein